MYEKIIFSTCKPSQNHAISSHLSLLKQLSLLMKQKEYTLLEQFVYSFIFEKM